MATSVHYFRGKAEWAKVYANQVDRKFPTAEGAGKFSIGLELDDASLIEFQKSGIRVRPKNGKYFFSRPEFRSFNGRREDLGPPKVVLFVANGHDQPFDKLIGNGSTVIVKVTAYDSKFGRGHRLEAVQVLDWVEYIRSDATPEGIAVPIDASVKKQGVPF